MNKDINGSITQYCPLGYFFDSGSPNAKSTRSLSGREIPALQKMERRPSAGAQLCALIVLVFTVGFVSPLQLEAAEIEVFTRADCPHCRDARPFLDQLQRERPSLRITYLDVKENPAALARLRQLARDRKLQAIGVPAFLIHGELIVGFGSAETTGIRIREALDRQPEESLVDVPFLGPVSVGEFGLPLFTIVVGLLDGFNPCAMWVLLFLLSLLVNLRNRARALLIGGVFVGVSGLAYFAFMAAWLNIFLLVGYPRAAQIALGIVALVVGALNAKDFFAFRRGPSLSIPESIKPGIYARSRRILAASSVAGAIGGAAVLAVLVNAVELACTAGLPALYTNILAMRSLPTWSYYGYLILYNFVYMFDDLIVLVIAVATLRRFKLQERGGRWLKLISGAVMLALGIALIVRPDFLMV
jgi:glutaredoxin